MSTSKLSDTTGQDLADRIDVERFEPKLRAVTDHIYEQILEDVTEYLKSNVAYNVQSEIDTLKHAIDEYRPYYNACAGLNPAAIPDVVAALRKLAGNAGALRAFEHDVRAAVGHTNWQCLADAVAEADAAIAKATGQAVQS